MPYPHTRFIYKATHISRTTLTVLCFKFVHSFAKVTLTTYYFYTFGVCFTGSTYSFFLVIFSEEKLSFFEGRNCFGEKECSRKRKGKINTPKNINFSLFYAESTQKPFSLVKILFLFCFSKKKGSNMVKINASHDICFANRIYMEIFLY